MIRLAPRPRAARTKLPLPGASFDQAHTLQLGVCARHRGQVDAALRRQLPLRRQAGAGGAASPEPDPIGEAGSDRARYFDVGLAAATVHRMTIHLTKVYGNTR